MTFRVHGLAGAQPIASNSTVKKHPLGTIVRATDETLGQAEFIYLTGVTSNAVGMLVNYDDAFTAALDTGAVTGPSRPIGVSMSAFVGSEYGWAQISGNAVAKKANSVSFADGAGLGSASGLAVAVATGTILQSAIVRTVASAKSDVVTVAIFINRPHTTTDVS